MKRLLLFAHFDKDDLIDPYVLHLLKAYQPHFARMIFLSDSNPSESETAKLDGLCEYVATDVHGEYDFGSWKRGFAYVQDELADYDEVVIANDSCFGPFYDFSEMFSAMEKKDCDFWGVSGTYTKRIKQYCVNSYFIAFRKPILNHEGFQTFWSQVTRLNSKQEIVGQYEYGLSDMLHAAKFRSETYIGWYHTDVMVSTAFFPTAYKKRRCPLVKVKIFRQNPAEAPHIGKWLARLKAGYPTRLIDDLIERYLGTKYPDHYDYKYPTFKTYYGHQNLLSFKGRYTKSRKWWRFYIKILGIPLTIVLPSRIPTSLR